MNPLVPDYVRTLDQKITEAVNEALNTNNPNAHAQCVFLLSQHQMQVQAMHVAEMQSRAAAGKPDISVVDAATAEKILKSHGKG